MKEKRKRSMKNQIATFIPECVVFVLGLVFVGILVYNFISGRNWLAYGESAGAFGVTGQLLNFVLLVLGCSISMAAGIALLVISIVGRYKDRIMWPHHVSFISSFVLMAIGFTSLALVLFVQG